MSQADKPIDVVIIGGGPAGLAAALYAARDRYHTVVLEKNGLPGGQIMLTEAVENYPGYVKIGGFELVEEMKKQVEAFGTEIRTSQTVTGLRRREDGLVHLDLADGEPLLAKAVILSPGSDYRQLGVPGEDRMRQATRVSYCATCDGAFYRDKHVLAVGGGNTAVEDTIYLATRFCKKVTLVHRRTEFRAQKVLVEELNEVAGEGKIDIRLPYVLDEIVPTDGGDEIDHVTLRNVDTGDTEPLKVDGVFIFVGMIPNTGFARDAVQMNDAGYIACDPISLKTSMPGVWVAGDCRQQAAMQLATATADGVVAAMAIRDYFKNPDHWEAQVPTEAGEGY
jgi:thioredoxin reductase (NADPH)